MSEVPFFSIITVSKNSGETIESAIHSLYTQTYKNIEYIIVDGASSDNTDEIVNRYRSIVSVYIREPDAGVFSAMNKGIAKAKGDFIYFLNSDDFFVDDTVLEDVANYITENPGCDIVYGDIEARLSSADRWIQSSPEPDEILQTLISGAMPHQATFTKSKVFQKIGTFIEGYKSAGDYEWWLRVASDVSLEKKHIHRTIASYYVGGASSNIERALHEMFEIQNGAEIYQSDYWLRERIKIFQGILKKPQGVWGLSRVTTPYKHDAKLLRAVKDRLFLFTKVSYFAKLKSWLQSQLRKQ